MEGVRDPKLNMSGFCKLDRNMLGCVEIIAGWTCRWAFRVNGDTAVGGLRSSDRGSPLQWR